MSRLLINENPLQVLPKLAAAIGLNEAIVLQQVHYWLSYSTTQKKGYAWTYNTVQQWQEQFPFWSDDTVRRTLASLRKLGLLIGERLSENRFDKTFFYRIDYEQLASLEDCILPPSNTPILPPSEDSKMPPSESAECHLEYKTETSTETTEKNILCETTFESFWQAYPTKGGRRIDKAGCRRIWAKRGLAEIADQILSHVLKAKETKQWKDGFEPSTKTYLNQNRWESGVPSEGVKGGEHSGFDKKDYQEGIGDDGSF